MPYESEITDKTGLDEEELNDAEKSDAFANDVFYEGMPEGIRLQRLNELFTEIQTQKRESLKQDTRSIKDILTNRNSINPGHQHLLIHTSPAQITANQNNYDIEANNFLRLSTDASRTISGFSGGAPGRFLYIVNVGSFNIVLSDQDTNSSATNRIITSSGDNLTLNADEAVMLWYDTTTERWRQIGIVISIDDLSDVVITSAAQGQVLYHNGTNWVNLAVGTSGQFLQTQGAAANPQWAAANDGFEYGGNGEDGAYTFADQGTAPSGTTKTDNTAGATIYQLDRDIYPSSMTINATVTLLWNGFRIFCSGTVTVNGTLSRKGNAGAVGNNGGTGSGGGNGGTGGAAGAVLTENWLLAGSAGQAGTVGGDGQAGIGGDGGNGSNGTSIARALVAGTAGRQGGIGGSSNQPLAGGNPGDAGGAGSITGSISNSPKGIIDVAITFIDPLTTGNVKINSSAGTGGSSGGGAGGGVSGSVQGGGGGGGGGAGSTGGIGILSCKTLAGNGTITCQGGAGGNGGTGGIGDVAGGNQSGGGAGGGGGSGGAGGVMVLIYQIKTFSGTLSVAGGTGGTGGTGGAAGGAGAQAGANGLDGNTGTAGLKIEIDI